MAGDLPDYTKYVTPQPVKPLTITGFWTKAETVTKKSAKADGTTACTANLDAPAVGKKTGLIVVVGSGYTAGDLITIYSRQSGTLTRVLDYIRIPTCDSKILVFPCWVPTQDVGDGSTSNVRVTVTSSACAGAVSVFVLYFEE